MRFHFLLGFLVIQIFGFTNVAALFCLLSSHRLWVLHTDGHFLLATGRDTLDKPTDFRVDLIDLIKLLAFVHPPPGLFVSISLLFQMKVPACLPVSLLLY
jgi:hypothetical protein